MTDQKLNAAATQIAAGDDSSLRGGERYDGVAMALHWATALLVISLFGLSQTWGFFPRGAPAQGIMQRLHVSLGITLAVVLLLRISWRVFWGRRLPAADSGWIGLGARGVHYLLYALLIGMVLAGFGKLWSRGRPLDFFGLFQIPSISVPESWRPVVDTAHSWGAWVLIGFVTLHGVAALYHHFVVRDGVLKRMLPLRRRRVAAH